MGIPAAFRWLSKKYPKIISPVLEDQPVEMEDGSVIPVDTTRPNPNGEEFDNLYLDMNGIVHPCSHPEDRPAPKDEEEMMLEIFKYTDRVVNMVRPRKILMIAVDGVAPRAKMNQQRSRRFRAAQEAKEKEEDKQQLLQLLKRQNGGVLKQESIETVTKKAFDSNSITPGTPFMDILASSLRYWCAYKLNTDPAWAKLKIIISDATVPGEGEHKIMDFVRSQRASPEHDPNTRHVIYGLDADLIMLGLATHEPHFRVLREDVFFQEAKAWICKLCGQKGHMERDCRGQAKEKEGEFDEKEKPKQLKPFIWLHVAVLREYLAAELDVPDLPFRFDVERAVDDWIFLCCFVGNDFLPHLPALEIREDGINTLTAIWRDNLPYMGGYVTKDGRVDLQRAQTIMAGLAKQEDAIFRRRKQSEDRREAGNKRRKLQESRSNGDFRRSYDRSQNGTSDASFPASLPKAVTHDMIVNRGSVEQANLANKSAASVLKNQIRGLMSQTNEPDASNETSGTAPETPPSALGKRKASTMEENGDSGTPGTSTPTPGTEAPSVDIMPEDTVKLWEEGYSDRYYEQKFKVEAKDVDFRRKVAYAYVEGLAWVLLYYFQGCPSWEWYYPYHYAPFAADFVEVEKLTIQFEKGRTSKPFEQLMSVLPAASRHAIPEVFHDLMLNPDSEVIDFYPEDFELDLNGKKFAWQGVVLLPFIDMERLLPAIEKKYPLLSPEDQARNSLGRQVLLLSDGHPTLYDEITTNFYSKKQAGPKYKLNPRTSDGLAGKVEKVDGYLPHGSLVYPLDRSTMPDVEYDRSLTVNYDFPNTSHAHKSMLLRGVKLPKPVLDRTEIEIVKGKAQRSGRSYGGAPLGSSGGYQNGGRRDQINYGPGGQHGGSDRGSHGPRGEYSTRGSYGGPPPPSWQPPPPGMPGFGIGFPPPPPPAHLGGGSYGNNGYGYGSGQSYPNSYGPPPSGSYGREQYRPPQSNYGGEYRPPHSDGNYGGQHNRYSGGDRRGGHRDGGFREGGYYDNRGHR